MNITGQIVDERFYLGVKEIDAQHSCIFAALESLQKVIAKTDQSHTVAAILETLHNLVSSHFAYEESFMERIDCADLQEHKQQHVELAELLEDCIRQTTPTKTDGRLDGELGDKLSAHLLTFDTKMESVVNRLIDRFRNHEVEEVHRTIAR